jgi:hypothetical protein
MAFSYQSGSVTSTPGTTGPVLQKRLNADHYLCSLENNFKKDISFQPQTKRWLFA